MIRVLIVAHSPIMQTGLEAMLLHEPTLQIVGRIGNLAALEQSYRTQQPDVIVLEFALLTDADREQLKILKTEVAIALLVAPTESFAAAMFLQSGVHAILPTDVTPDEIVLTLTAIAAGLIVLHPDVSETWLQSFSQTGEPEIPAEDLSALLTRREIEVLQLLATGLGNRAIARQLNISEHTVKFHISSIFSKLNASSRTEAVTLAMRQGLIFI